MHLTITSKRQATFPVETCRELGLNPGDTVDLEPRMENGKRLWVLRPRQPRSRPWAGVLRLKDSKITDHSMEAIRASIAKGRAEELKEKYK